MKVFDEDTTVVTSTGTWRFTKAFAWFDFPSPINPVTATQLFAAQAELLRIIAGETFRTGRPIAEPPPNPTVHQYTQQGLSRVITPLTGHLVASGSVMNMQIADDKGNIIHDSARGQRDLATRFLINRLSDMQKYTSLAFVHERYRLAVVNEAGLLGYLYDIKEAINKHFKDGEAGAEAALQGYVHLRRALGKLTNGPLSDGRHAGKHHQDAALRSSNENERVEALRIAREMIEQFALHLRTMHP